MRAHTHMHTIRSACVCAECKDASIVIFSQGSCLVWWGDVSGAGPNGPVSHLNCLLTRPLVGVAPMSCVQHAKVTVWAQKAQEWQRTACSRLMRIWHRCTKLAALRLFCSSCLSESHRPHKNRSFHLLLADSYESERRQGGARRVCVFHGEMDVVLYYHWAYFFLSSPPPRYSVTSSHFLHFSIQHESRTFVLHFANT